MVSQTTEAPDEQNEEQPQEESSVADKQCPHCSFKYEKNRAGSARYMQHLRKEHPDKTKKAQAAAAGAAETAAQSAELSPLGEQFAQAIRRIVPNKANITETLTKMFNRNSGALMNSRSKFRGWMSKYGLTTDQLEVLTDEMFGMEDEHRPGETSADGRTIGYMPGPNGYMQPIILPAGGGGAPGSPMIVMPQANSGQDIERVASQLREEMKELAGSFEASLAKLTDVMAERITSQPQQQALMIRTPAIGADGKPLTTEAGQPVYIERPYSPQDSTMEMFRTFIPLLTRDNDKSAFDPDKFLLQMKEVFRREEPAAELSPAMKEKLDAQTVQMNALVQKLNSMEREREMKDLLAEATAQFEARMEGRVPAGTLSDRQYELHHKETLQHNTLDFFGNIFQGVDRRVGTMIKPFAVNQMRTMGIPDESIIRIVGPIDADDKVASGALGDRIRQAETKWLK